MSLRLDGKPVVQIIGWFPHAIVGNGREAKELAVLKVRLDDESERLVSFPCPPK